MTKNLLETYFTELTDIVCKISEAYRYKGKFDKAMLLFDSIKPLFDTHELKNEDKARILIQFAKIRMDHKFLKDFNYNTEINMLKEAQILAEMSNTKDIQADALDLHGNCIYRIGILNGDFKEALTYYNKALSIRTKINNKLGLSKSYFHLGLYHENKKDAEENDHQTALDYYEKGLKIAEEEDFKLEQSYFFRHIAYIYAFIKEDLDKGLEYFKRSTQLREEIGFIFNLQFAYFAEAFVYFLKKDMDNARNYFTKAYSAAIKVNRSDALRVLIIRRGDAIIREIDLEAALKYYDLILNAAKKLNDKNGIREIKLKIEEINKSK
ncbi:MAG: tetratricopeptide repeat protein [Candidatus Lokiarchaeota archaeon]|nr:tetratricopeptide repeat protein [Candidatus Lokiarchaeota archaeon]